MPLTGLAEALLQTCATFLDFRQQRRFVRTCRCISRAIDHPQSLAHIWDVEYPYNRVTDADVVMAIIVRNRTSRLVFREPEPYDQERLWARHLAQLCAGMPQLTQLRVAVNTITESELACISKLVLLTDLDLAFIGTSPSLRILVDNQQQLPCLHTLVLTWHHEWSLSQTIGMCLTQRPDLYDKSLSAIEAVQRSSVSAWTRTPGFEDHYRKILELVDRDHYRGMTSLVFAAIHELDTLCPSLDLKPDAARHWLRVFHARSGQFGADYDGDFGSTYAPV
jgi:hypothetical protein